MGDLMETLLQSSLVVYIICFCSGTVVTSVGFFQPVVTVFNIKFVLQSFGVTMMVFNFSHGCVSYCARLGVKSRSSFLLIPLLTFMAAGVIYLGGPIIRQTILTFPLAS